MTKAQQWLPFASEIIGIRAGTKKPLTSGWSTWNGTVAHMQSWERNGHSFGMLARKYPGIDIDVTLPGLTAVCQSVAEQVFGVAPLRVRAGSAKRLLMYRTDETLRKRRLVFTAADGSEHAVELLATGQQYVVDGKHPDGSQYTWLGAPSPWDLTPVTGEQWDAYCEAVAARLVTLGCTIVKDGRGGATRTDGQKRAADELLAPEPAVDPLAAMMQWRERHNDVHMPHDDFVQLCASFRGATGDHADELFEQFRECLPGERATEANTDKTFNSFDAGVTLGWSRLCQLTGFVPPDTFEAEPAPGSMDVPDPGDVARTAMLDRYVYVRGIKRFYDCDTGALLDKEQFCDTNTTVAPAGTSGRNSSANVFLNHGRARMATEPTYRPDVPGEYLMTEERDGVPVQVCNTYRPSSLKPVEGDVTPWLKHVAMIAGQPDEGGCDGYRFLLDYLAYIVQFPGRKVNYAPVLLGGEGEGKDLMLRPVVLALGQHNVATIDPNDVQSWNDWAQKQLVIVNEMAHFGQRDMMNGLKKYLAAPPAGVRISKKYLNAYEVPNIFNTIMMTNHDDALKVTDDARRYWVWETGLYGKQGWETKEKKSAYFHEFKDIWLDTQDGYAKAYHYLLHHKISTSFDPRGDAPATDAKARMMQNTRNQSETTIAGLFEDGRPLHGWKLVTAHDIRAHLSGYTYVSNASITRTLRELGFKYHKQVRLGDERERIWAPYDLGHKEPKLLAAEREKQRKRAG